MSNDISQYSIQELQQALAEKEEQATKTPEIVDNPEVDRLKQLAESYMVQDVLEGRELDAQFALEELMEVYYGKDFWGWCSDYAPS